MKKASGNKRRWSKIDPKKICHITKATGVAGSERHLLTLLTSLDRAKYQVALVLLVEWDKPLDDFVHRFEEEGVQVKRVLVRGDIDPLLVWRLHRLLREGKYDLVHTHLIHADLYGTLAAKLAGVPIVVSTKHNDDAFRHHPFFAFLDGTASKFVNRIVVISDSLKRFFIEVEGLNRGKITRIYYGLDPAEFGVHILADSSVREEFGIEANAPLAGIVARLDPQKGHTYLLTAFAKVVEILPEARLLVVGDGYLGGDLERQARELGIAQQVIFTGWRDDAPRIMAGIDLLVAPSLWEGFGLVLLEAMAAAKPVVASQVSAIPEIVIDGETGVLVPPKDPDALAEALIKLLRNPTLAREMGRKGKERLENEFSLEKMVERTERVYERLFEQEL